MGRSKQFARKSTSVRPEWLVNRTRRNVGSENQVGQSKRKVVKPKVKTNNSRQMDSSDQAHQSNPTQSDDDNKMPDDNQEKPDDTKGNGRSNDKKSN